MKVELKGNLYVVEREKENSSFKWIKSLRWRRYSSYEQLSKSWGSVTNIVQPDPNSQVLTTQDLGNSFYIESTYTTQELINSIQLLLYLGSTTSSTFTVQVIQDGVIVQPYSIKVVSSTQWNTIGRAHYFRLGLSIFLHFLDLNLIP